MAKGYTWRPIIKQVPQNGAEVLVDLALGFTDCRGPRSLKLQYVRDVEKRYDINRRARPLHRGFRMKAVLMFWIREITEHPTFVDIANRLGDGDWTTYLSLDAGTTYNEMWSDSVSGPDPIRSTRVGAEVGLSLESVDLLQDIPYISGQYALPNIGEPYNAALPPSIALRGHIRYVRSINGAPGTLVAYGEDSNGNPVVQTLWDFGP